MNYLYLISDIKTNGFLVEILDILSLICILFGIYTIISKNPIVSVLFLIGLFSTISCYLILIGLSFIGISYLLVYVGAISILFIFILMLINIRISELLSDTYNYLPLAILSVIPFVYILGQNISFNSIQFNFINYFYNSFFEKLYNIKQGQNPYFYNIIDYKQQIIYASGNNWDTVLTNVTHITSIGNIMYSTYSIWLLITSIILLLAMIGSIVITINPEKKFE
jgi:NADH-ubiquinone oxidoreductase chain 6